ncbi:pilus assembly protein PilM [Candidatus Pelagisphaera phototrophica]|uniref:pilus assembly protein PilM n=1 Tax=Candidatus Pelagisphaera phototrophica TaxID=2684113 RepID=UPI0024B7B4A4|nr:pilus assembly protein PilM [Candidatus Pelagisphaera phototrophica]QXD31976.1 pilus assembly protein PilM [Candidatus Pelagisphaera phototrophica]
MNTSGRCELVNYWRRELDQSLSEPLLWLKAASQSFGDVRSRFKGDMPVGYALPGNLVLTKYLKIPQVPVKKREKVVAFEARQNIPYPIADVAWDDNLIDEDDLDFETVIAASKSELVESLSLYGKQSKMDPDVIEPTFVGLINAFRFNEPETSGCSLLLSIGAKSTDIVFFDGSKFYSRNVSLGGNTVTQEIRGALDLPFDDAENIKRAAIAGDPLPTGEHIAFREAQESFLKKLNIEISRTLAIYKNHGYDDDPVRCYITGGGSLLPNLQGGLGDRLGLPVGHFDPLKEVRVSTSCSDEKLEMDKAFLAEAIGIAIGRFLPDSTQINLLPRSILWQRKFKRQQPYYLFAGLVACASIALPLVNTKIAAQRYEEEIRNLDSKVIPLRELNTRINNRIADIEKLRSVIGEASMIAESRSNWIQFLNDIQSRLDDVEDVWIDRIEVARPVTLASNTSNRFNSKRNNASAAEPSKVRLHLEGRLLDVSNPLSTVSQESNRRVSALLDSFAASEFVEGLENESFDNNVPGILKFNFTLVVDSARPL